MDVVLVRWPSESVRRDRLVVQGLPRLLVMEDGVGPPPPLDCLEDWIRVPAVEADVQARVEALALRAHRHLTLRPELDAEGVLHVGSRWVPLPPVEARITSALLERWEGVVSRDTLGRAGWPTGAPGRNALDVHVLRLRRRIHPLGLSIRTVRSRGYLLQGPSQGGQARESKQP